MKRGLKIFGAILLASGTLCGSGLNNGDRLGPVKEVRQYAHRVWTMKDGMPQGAVRAIAQTTDGYLWIGTMQGLTRFDGTRFTTYTPVTTPQLKDVIVNALLATDDGVLWIGTPGGLTLFKNGRFDSCENFEELSRAPIRSFTRGRGGIVWISTPSGLAVATVDSVKRWWRPEKELYGAGVVAAFEMDDGSLLVSTTKRGVQILEHDRFRPHPALADQVSMITGFFRDAAGNVWMISADSGVLCLQQNGTVVSYRGKPGFNSRGIYSLSADRSGAVWFGGAGGQIDRFFKDRMSSVRTREGFRSEVVYAIFHDREGNLWAGTSTASLHRYVDGAFETFRTGTTPADQMVWLVANDPRSGLVAGNESGQLLRWNGETFVRQPSLVEGLDNYPFAYLRDANNSDWVGTPSGLHVVRKGKRDFFPLGTVSCIIEDRNGSVWVGTPKGLYQFCGQGIRSYNSTNGLPHPDVRWIVESRSGGFWLGTGGGGLVRLQPDTAGAASNCPATYVVYSKERGLGSNWVTSLVEDSAGTVWVTTLGYGIKVLRNGTLHSLGPEDGLPGQSFLTVLEDNLGYLWCSSNCQIFRFKKSDLLARIDGRPGKVPWAAFGIDDGLVSEECNGGFQASGARTQDGRLWFPTTEGVAMVDPRLLRMDVGPPPVVLERAAIDREEGSPFERVEMLHGNGELEFQYAGIFMAAPGRVRYRFLLEGFDREWVEAGSRRAAYYTNIPPGDYTFRVQASVADGIWSSPAATASITLSPHFYQTRWFMVLCVLLVTGFFTGMFFVYRRDQELELRSSRLASDLAKTQLQVLEMQLQPHFLFNTLNSIMVLIGKDPQTAQRTVARLANILRRSLDRRGTQEVTLQEELEFLDRYLEIERLRFGDRLTVEHHVGAGVGDALVPNMLFQPLVENAIRHGVSARRGPARIDVVAEREDGRLVLHVKDNGVGLQGNGTEMLKMGIGLGNTRERLQRLYGHHHQLELKSLPEGGVDVQVVIPYHKESKGHGTDPYTNR